MIPISYNIRSLMVRRATTLAAVMGTTRVADFAMVARRHMYEYGTTSEQLAEVAVAQRHSATLHPRAVMRDNAVRLYGLGR